MPQDAGPACCRCAMTCASEFASAFFAAQYKSLIIIIIIVLIREMLSTLPCDRTLLQ